MKNHLFVFEKITSLCSRLVLLRQGGDLRSEVEVGFGPSKYGESHDNPIGKP
jgi:hypothetical protein